MARIKFPCGAEVECGPLLVEQVTLDHEAWCHSCPPDDRDVLTDEEAARKWQADWDRLVAEKTAALARHSTPL